MPRRMVWRLDSLQPEWVAQDGGWGHGVRWTCGRHASHPLEVYFRNPCDGLTPTVAGRLYTRIGTSFSTLTLVEDVDLDGCFIGWVVDGLFLQEVH